MISDEELDKISNRYTITFCGSYYEMNGAKIRVKGTVTEPAEVVQQRQQDLIKVIDALYDERKKARRFESLVKQCAETMAGTVCHAPTDPEEMFKEILSWEEEAK